MSASWMVSVQGRAYGPYTDAQMQAFANEGRLAPQSLVARSGETEFRIAGSEPELARFFAPMAPANSAPAATVTPMYSVEPAASGFGRQDDSTRPGTLAHIVVIADMKSRSIDGLEEELFKLGPAVALLPQVWLLSTEQSINAVRNLLVQQLGKLDKLFVIDATRDKMAWFNFAPEVEARIRRNWARTSDAAAKLSAAS